jgi:hypothetical protein
MAVTPVQSATHRVEAADVIARARAVLGHDAAERLRPHWPTITGRVRGRADCLLAAETYCEASECRPERPVGFLITLAGRSRTIGIPERVEARMWSGWYPGYDPGNRPSCDGENEFMAMDDSSSARQPRRSSTPRAW